MRENIPVPKKLLEIPYPWNITSSSKRWEEREKLDKSEENFKNALISADISLSVLQNIHLPGEEFIPSDLYENWGFTAEEIATHVCKFDMLTYSSIEAVLKSNKFESSSEETIKKWQNFGS